ncbi:alpha/beta fold hydrolase [Ketobacter sp.]|uniref:alpha/beta fold hydrolase n=1 Tax=Ketobacter sp. TaxID=2083498 RepID=UPI000F290776|nr:alpha/beta hydrolase [Ketobacter sp.]RLT92229.1 MAG: alpha/beta hydrolase [Ketobacter sp.]
MNHSPRQWKSMGKSLRLNGHSLFVLDSADVGKHPTPDKPCILLLHGYPTSSWDWERLWPLLTEDFRLIALDFLGFGFSDKPYPYHYRIQEQADIVEALVQQLGLTQFHVLSHDYGDTVAQELLARQNEREHPQWLSVCLLNGGLFPETHRARLIQKWLAGPLGPFLTRHMGKQSIHNTMKRIFGPETQPDAELIEGYWELINFNNGRRTLHKLIDYMKQRRQHRARWVQALADSRIPIGLINGAVDPISGAHMVARYKEVVGPPLMILSLANIGHYPQWEAPDQVNQAYRQFLQAALD